MNRRTFVVANGVFRPWYVSFQKGERGLAPVYPQPAARLVHMLLDGGLRQAQPGGDFLVSQKGRQPQALFLAGAETLRHSMLRYERNSYGVRPASSSAATSRSGSVTKCDIPRLRIDRYGKWCRLGDSNT